MAGELSRRRVLQLASRTGPLHVRRIRVRFADFTGRTVYHCHILDHEDEGMMAVLVAF